MLRKSEISITIEIDIFCDCNPMFFFIDLLKKKKNEPKPTIDTTQAVFHTKNPQQPWDWGAAQVIIINRIFDVYI